MSVAVAQPLVRRKVPAAVRRKRFLLAVANHSLLIVVAVMFLAPFFFIVAWSIFTESSVTVSSPVTPLIGYGNATS